MLSPFLIGLALFAIFICILYILSPLIAPKRLRLNGEHVIVTGGSSGIGKAIAIEAVKRGANITLLARNKSRLAEAKLDVEQYRKDPDKQKVLSVSVDLSREYGAVEKAVKQAEDQLGPVLMLVNCAGYSVSGYFEELPIEEFKKQMDVNYMGTVYATRAVVGTMKKRRKGRIVMLSSQAGQLGLFGFTAYSASKFALRGFAEALQMELKPYSILVSLAFPPDTDTPGYKEEMVTKPKETRLISETAGLFQPDYVAKSVLDDAEHGRFLCPLGLDGVLLSNLTSGMSPVISIMEATQQVVTMGLFRIISLLYLENFDRIVKRCAVEKEEKEEMKMKTQ